MKTNLMRQWMLYSLYLLFSAYSIDAIAQEFMPNGLIITRVRYVSELGPIMEYDSACSFVSVKFPDNRVYLCTDLIELNGDATVVVESPKGQFKTARFVELIEDGHDVNDAESFIRKHLAFPLEFFPLVQSSPTEKAALEIWQQLQQRSVDLSEAAKEMSIPNTAEFLPYVAPKNAVHKSNNRIIRLPDDEQRIYGKQQTAEIGRKVKSKLIGDSEPVYYFETNIERTSGNAGGAFFRSLPTDGDSVSKEFLGISAYDFDNPSSDKLVIMHPLTIVLLFRLKHGS